MTKIRVTALTADGDPYGNALVTAEGLNIQSIEWQIDNVSLTCDLTVARS